MFEGTTPNFNQGITPQDMDASIRALAQVGPMRQRRPIITSPGAAADANGIIRRLVQAMSNQQQ